MQNQHTSQLATRLLISSWTGRRFRISRTFFHCGRNPSMREANRGPCLGSSRGRTASLTCDRPHSATSSRLLVLPDPFRQAVHGIHDLRLHYQVHEGHVVEGAGSDQLPFLQKPHEGGICRGDQIRGVHESPPYKLIAGTTDQAQHPGMAIPVVLPFDENQAVLAEPGGMVEFTFRRGEAFGSLESVLVAEKPKVDIARIILLRCCMLRKSSGSHRPCSRSPASVPGRHCTRQGQSPGSSPVSVEPFQRLMGPKSATRA